MATINDFIPTDDVHDVLARWIVDLIPTSLRSEYKNTETLSADRALLDADTPIQVFDPDGGDYDVILPDADAVENHPFMIRNGGSSGTISVKSNDEVTTHAVLTAGQRVLMLPDGNGTYMPFGRTIALSSASPRVYTANDTWNKPANLAYVIVELVGGGGGGGGVSSAAGQSSCAMAGGGGEYAKKRIDADDLGSSETVTVGASGAGGAAGANNGSSGGNTSFGSHVSANGGGGGNSGVPSMLTPTHGSSVGGTGGTGGTGGDLHIAGSPGIGGARWSTTNVIASVGGGSHLSGFARSNTNALADEDGVAGVKYGGGGSGARSSDTTTNYAGGAGAAGVVIVWEYVYIYE